MWCTTINSRVSVFNLAPANHSVADKIPLTKVGRRLYTVRHRESGVERSIICQIDTVEGSKKVTIRSPVQVWSRKSCLEDLCMHMFEVGHGCSSVPRMSALHEGSPELIPAAHTHLCWHPFGNPAPWGKRQEGASFFAQSVLYLPWIQETLFQKNGKRHIRVNCC